MSLWVGLGPFRVSSRGRVGVRAGPVGIYGGGRRRRSSSNDESGCAVILAILLVCAVIYFIVMYVVMWPLSVWGHAIGLTPSYHELRHANHVWEHRHYALVGLRYVAAAASLLILLIGSGVLLSRLGRSEKSRGPAAKDNTGSAPLMPRPAGPDKGTAASTVQAIPHIDWPKRFTQAWIEDYVPELSPSEFGALVTEMGRRGWTETDIRRRVQPYCHH